MDSGDGAYTQRLEAIEKVLARWLPGGAAGPGEGPAWLGAAFGLPGDAVPPALAGALARPGWDLVNRGGKRWRPLFMTLVAETLAGEAGREAALPLTPLVEFPHNASLIHDDIEDNAEERRGKPAVHLLYGTDTAINSGAFLYFLPLACLEAAALPPEVKLRLYAVWGEHLRRLHLGQAMDIAWHRDDEALPGVEEYLVMCALKTGCLARLAAVLGAICAGREDAAAAAGAGAEKLGVGFQILDDVKNLTCGVPGKRRGDDVVEGKKSLPVLLFLHRRPDRRGFAARCFAAARAGGTSAPEVEEFIRALGAEGVLEESRERGRALLGESRELLRGLPGLPGAGRALLEGLIEALGAG